MIDPTEAICKELIDHGWNVCDCPNKSVCDTRRIELEFQVNEAIGKKYKARCPGCSKVFTLNKMFPKHHYKGAQWVFTDRRCSRCCS